MEPTEIDFDVHVVALLDHLIAAWAVHPGVIVASPGASRGCQQPPRSTVAHAVDPELQLGPMWALFLDPQGPAVRAAPGEPERAAHGYHPALLLEVPHLCHDLA